MRKLILFLAAVSLVLSAEKALCYETTFSIEPESFNSFRYQEMRVEEAAPLSIRTGRFLSVDPTWSSVNKRMPQSWNRYTYALNNPVLYTDPDGRCAGVTALPWPGWLVSGGRAVATGAGTRTAGAAAGPIGLALANAAITGWQIGRGIGTSTIGGRTIDSRVEALFVSMMSSNSDGVFWGDKIDKQLGKRGWDETGVLGTIDNPDRVLEGRDTRHLPGGVQVDQPAVVYVNADGSYVVVNAVTGEVVQVSNRNDPNWKNPWDKPEDKKPDPKDDDPNNPDKEPKP